MHIFYLIRNAVREELKYKINLFGGVVALVVFYSLQFVFFEVISKLVPSAVLEPGWLLVFFMSYALGSLIVKFFSAGITGFFGELTQGRLDVFLVRPLNFFTLMLFRWGETYFLLVALILIGVFVASGKVDLFQFLCSGVNVFLYVFVMVVGVASNVSFLLALNSFSFITQRQLPVDYIHASVFTFALLPGTFYSINLLYFLVVMLPMVVFATVALDALYNGLTLLVSVFCTVVLITLWAVVSMVRRLFNRFDSVGG